VTPFEQTLADIRRNAELKELAQSLDCGRRNYLTAMAAAAHTTTSAHNWGELRRYLINEMQFSGLRVWDIATEFFNNTEGKK